MHEMSICMSMVEMLTERLQQEGGERVLGVRLELGALGHVDAHALAFCFASVARGGPLEGARLDIAVCPGRAYCFDCRQSVALAERLDPCPRCAGVSLRIDGGDQLRVTEMEIA